MLVRNSIVASLALFLVACGGGGNGGGGNNPPPPSTYSIGGTVTGLTGTVVLQSPGASDLSLSANGTFTVASNVSSGTSYAVTVKTQPGNPTQRCTVSNGSGSVAAANVTNIEVACAAVPLTLNASTPAADATGVDPDAALTLDFSAPLATPLPASGVTLSSVAGNQDVTVAVADQRITVTPSAALQRTTEYTLTVTTGVRGSGGEQLAAPLTVHFMTVDRKWQAPLSADSNAVPYAPRIAMNAGGAAMLVYTRYSAAGSDVRARGFTPAGQWAAPITLDTVATAELPDVGVDGQGNAVAVWSRSPAYTAARYYNAATGTWGAAGRIVSTVSAEYAPRVAMNNAGNAVAVWQYNVFNDVYQTHASRFTAGAGWSAQAETSSGSTVDHLTQHEVAMDTAGNALVLEEQASGAFTEIWAHHGTLTAWDSATRITSSSAGVSAPRVAFDGTGNALVVWAESDTVHYNLWARYYSTAAGWGPARKIEDNDTANAQSPDVAFDGAGNALVVWQQSDGAHTSVWYNRLSAGSWGTAALAEKDDSGNASQPHVVMDAAGHGLLVFAMDDGTRAALVANRYLAGRGWGTVVPVETDAATDCFQPMIAMDANGNAIATWVGISAGVAAIRVARFD